MNRGEWFSISDLPDEQYEACMAVGKAIKAVMDSTEPQYAMTGVVGAICNYVGNTYEIDRHARIIELLAQACLVTLKGWANEDSGYQ
jgi:hypothetical protein